MHENNNMFELKKNLKMEQNQLKGQCHENFWHFLFYESNPPGPLINWLKCFFLKNSFSRRHSNFKFEKFNSALCQSAWSHFFANISAKMNLSAKPFSLFMSCPVGLDTWNKKMQKKSRDTATLSMQHSRFLKSKILGLTQIFFPNRLGVRIQSNIYFLL